MREHKLRLTVTKYYLTGKRKEDVFISRIRIGHSRLTHGYLMKPRAEQELPRCGKCNQILTIKHILIECSEYEQKRCELWSSPDLQSVLTETLDNTRKLIEFFKEIQLFDDI
jgi:hypothetical protein